MKNKILLVDDDQNLLKAYTRTLRGKYEIVVAENARQGMSLLSGDESFAVVVSDYMMPGIDGIRFLAEARISSPDTIRIMLTGRAEMEVVTNAIKQGSVFRFLSKPCSSEQLLEAINDAVEEHEIVARQKETWKSEIKKSVFEKISLTAITAINAMLERRDPYTASHQTRVAVLAEAIARDMGVEPEMVAGVEMAATVHDIGKVYIPIEILGKPGKISDLEFSLIKTHARAGHEILKDIEFPWPVAEIVLQHHERWNGSGYPTGLAGEDIRLEARIIGVADVVEAIASHRPYRPSLGVEKAMEEIIGNRGVLYDARVVDACWRLMERGELLL